MTAGRTEGLIKTLRAGETIYPHRILKFGADEETVLLNVASTVNSLGVSKVPLGAEDPIKFNLGLAPVYKIDVHDPVDVVLTELVEVEFGGTVQCGQWVVPGAGGKGFAITPAASGATVNYAIGKATISGSAGTVGVVLLQPAVIITA